MDGKRAWRNCLEKYVAQTIHFLKAETSFYLSLAKLKDSYDQPDFLLETNATFPAKIERHM